MAVRTYKKGDTTKLARNFSAYEFDDGKSRPCSCTTTLIDDNLPKILQAIRDALEKAHPDMEIRVQITSGYRCPAYNGSTKNSATKSRHVQGMAADIVVPGIKPREVAQTAESLGVKGIGLYETDADGHFVHVDTRTTKAFWYGQAQASRSTFGGKTASTSTSNTTKPSTSTSTSSSGKLTEDGKWGKTTTKRLQQIFGTPVDGIVSNQLAKYKDMNPGLVSGWEWLDKPNGKGSALIKEMQKWAGMPADERDGLWGTDTCKAVQKKLGTYVDGEVSCPSQMVKALQKWANSQ